MVDFLECTELEKACKSATAKKLPRKAWNSGKAQGKRKPFTPEQTEKIFTLLYEQKRYRELAIFTLGVDTSLRSGNLMKLRVSDVCYQNGTIKDRFSVIQEKLKTKSRNQVECVLTSPTKHVLIQWLRLEPKAFQAYLFSGQKEGSHLSCDQLRRYVKRFAREIDLPDEEFSSHSLRRTKPSVLYQLSGNDILIPQQILGHGSIKSTQEYLNEDSEKALKLAQETVLFGRCLDAKVSN